MHYWNEYSFKGLAQLAEALGEDPRLLSLTEYCRLRERGLRRNAFEALDSFISATETWDTAYARDTCQRILELHALTPEAHQFITQPLLTRFIFSVLDAWVADEPTSQAALRWLGILRGDTNLLRKALRLSPDDVPVRRRLAGWFLSEVDFATHHLVESRFLGDLAATKQALAQARAIIEAAGRSAPAQRCLR